MLNNIYFVSTTSSVLLSLSIALLAGLLMSRVVKFLKLPAVTAYLIAGILIGPMLLGRLNVDGLGIIESQLDGLKILSELALGFIAFAMGNEFRLSQLKKIGKAATVIGIFQAAFTTLVVIPTRAVADTLATAPAATLMVVKQYKAKGPLTDILLPVVALDDAVGLIIFAISFGIAKSINVGTIDIVSIVVEPLLEIILSLGLGAILGYLFTLCEKLFHSRSKRMAVTVTFVMMAVALSSLKFNVFGLHVAFSSLLTCMMLGTIFCNICDFSEELMARADRWTAPILILFFVISGAELKLNVFSDLAIVLIGVVYILFRSLGKYFGATISAKITKCDPNIVKYLGITLLPQAGVALGMAIKAGELGDGIGSIISNITLFAVLIYEIVGPFLTKVCLTKAGDIDPTGRKSTRGIHPEENEKHF